MSDKTILNLNHISHAFNNPDGSSHLVLDDISLTIKENEVVALLGKSGCGKSTLLRILSGLINPSGGTISYHDGLSDLSKNTAMVFQTFALFPWLTIYENVALGLENMGLYAEEVREKTVKALRLIGLEGYETAYPKELSGGMRQRVGFARALAVDPIILLLDEPFSALDVLTSETLRGDLLDLWIEKIIPLKAIVLVTHTIEEAIFLADRIILLSSNPGKVATIIDVDLPHPRDKYSHEFRKLVEMIYEILSQEIVAEADIVNLGAKKLVEENEKKFEHIPFTSPNKLIGLLETLDDRYKGYCDITTLATDLNLNLAEIMPIIDTAKMLHFLSANHQQLTLTPSGKILIEGNNIVQKKIFAEHLIRYSKSISYIRRAISESESKHLAIKDLEKELANQFNVNEIKNIINTIINWGRYAQLFSYDYRFHILYLR